MARRASVTVSMAADTIGMFSSSFRVRRVFRETSRGRTREWAGRRRTSSKVSAFWMTRMFSSRKAALYSHQMTRLLLRSLGFTAGFALALVLSSAAMAQQYKWVDKDGRVQYGDSP